jgi:chitin disaccharide deacetylase
MTIKFSHLLPRFLVRASSVDKTRVRTLAERLGYSPQDRLLIVHADDIALAQSVNTAFINGLATGLINSGSVIVPASWFSEFAKFAQAHPDADIGLHLTLTSEPGNEPWAPIASRTDVPSLVDEHGYFLQKWTSDSRGNPREVEIELRAQIEKAYTAGLRPTHLDSHQFLLQLGGKDVFAVFVGLGREYHLPVLVTREWVVRRPYMEASLTPRDAVLDRIVIINPSVTAEQWPAFYRRALESLRPGVTEFVIHPGYDNEELRAFFEDRLMWGSSWRQRDFDFFTSDMFRTWIAEHDVKLVTWREIAAAIA